MNRSAFLLATRAKKKKVPQQAPKKKEVYREPKRNSEEYTAILRRDFERKKSNKEKKFYEEISPRFAAAMLFGCVVPQSILLYKMIWADACSDEFF